jgi:hypothetical protein
MIGIAVQVLSLIETYLLPLVLSGGNAALVTSIIQTLTKMLPLIVTEIADLKDPVKNIISVLSDAPGTTDEQLASLKTLDAKADAAFEAIAAETDAEAG